MPAGGFGPLLPRHRIVQAVHEGVAEQPTGRGAGGLTWEGVAHRPELGERAVVLAKAKETARLLVAGLRAAGGVAHRLEPRQGLGVPVEPGQHRPVDEAIAVTQLRRACGAREPLLGAGEQPGRRRAAGDDELFRRRQARKVPVEQCDAIGYLRGRRPGIEPGNQLPADGGPFRRGPRGREAEPKRCQGGAERGVDPGRTQAVAGAVAGERFGPSDRGRSQREW